MAPRDEPERPTKAARRRVRGRRPVVRPKKAPRGDGWEGGVSSEAEVRSEGEGRVKVEVPLPSVVIRPPPPRVLPPPAPSKERTFGVDAIEEAGGGALVARNGPAVAHIDADGSIRFERSSALEKAAGIGWGLAQLNPLPLINAVTGEDGQGGAKLAILKATEERRARMRAKIAREQLSAAVNDTRGRLESLWTDGSQSAVERRQALFAVWDECAEEGPEAVVEAARLVRSVVLEFITEHLPSGHVDAFSAAELEALNRARHSTARFVPYE